MGLEAGLSPPESLPSYLGDWGQDQRSYIIYVGENEGEDLLGQRRQ